MTKKRKSNGAKRARNLNNAMLTLDDCAALLNRSKHIIAAYLEHAGIVPKVNLPFGRGFMRMWEKETILAHADAIIRFDNERRAGTAQKMRENLTMRVTSFRELEARVAALEARVSGR